MTGFANSEGMFPWEKLTSVVANVCAEEQAVRGGGEYEGVGDEEEGAGG